MEYDKNLLGVKELMEYLSVGRNLAMKIGEESGAKLKIGRRTLYRKSVIDKHIEKIANRKEE